MDPLICIVPEIHDYVFLHFSVEDFREVTKVSPNWNETIGESRVMMKEVKLSLIDLYQLIVFEQLCSSRRYRSLLLKLGLIRQHCGYNIPYKTLECFVSMSSKVDELEIKCFYELSSANEKLFDRIQLSGIKVLKLYCVTEKLVDKLLSKCNSLTELKLNRIVERSFLPIPNLKPSIPNWPAFLERNQSLEVLEFGTNELYNALFENDLSEVARCKLKILRVYNSLIFDVPTTPEQIERNFLKFLVKQSPSLECFHVDLCSSKILVQAFNRMPALTSLSIEKYFGEETFSLGLNEKIVDLRILYIDCLESFERICRSVPNLSKFMTLLLTADNLKIIASFLPHLQKLLFSDCEVTDGQPIFRSLWPHATPRQSHEEIGGFWSIEKQETMNTAPDKPEYDANNKLLAT